MIELLTKRTFSFDNFCQASAELALLLGWQSKIVAQALLQVVAALDNAYAFFSSKSGKYSFAV